MLNRVLYVFLLAITLVSLYVRGWEYANVVRLGHGTTASALLDLAYLITLVALAVLIARRLFRRSPRIHQLSLRGLLRWLSGQGPEAFSRSPVIVILMILFLSAIPFGLVILRAGGWDNLGRFQWLLIGFLELPLVFVIAVAIFGPKTSTEPTT